MKVEPRWAHMRDTPAAVWVGAPAVLGGGHSASWSDKEGQQLKSLVMRDGARLKDWSTKAELLGTGRSELSVKQYYYKRLRAELAVEAAVAERERTPAAALMSSPRSYGAAEPLLALAAGAVAYRATSGLDAGAAPNVITGSSTVDSWTIIDRSSYHDRY